MLLSRKKKQTLPVTFVLRLVMFIMTPVLVLFVCIAATMHHRQI